MDSNVFVRTFVRRDPVLHELLLAAHHVPEGDYCKKALSCTDKLILSPGEAVPGVAGVSGYLGRKVYGSSLKNEALMLSRTCARELPGCRLGWRRLRQFSEVLHGAKMRMHCPGVQDDATREQGAATRRS